MGVARNLRSAFPEEAATPSSKITLGRRHLGRRRDFKKPNIWGEVPSPVPSENAFKRLSVHSSWAVL